MYKHNISKIFPSSTEFVINSYIPITSDPDLSRTTSAADARCRTRSRNTLRRRSRYKFVEDRVITGFFARIKAESPEYGLVQPTIPGRINAGACRLFKQRGSLKAGAVRFPRRALYVFRQRPSPRTTMPITSDRSPDRHGFGWIMHSSPEFNTNLITAYYPDNSLLITGKSR